MLTGIAASPGIAIAEAFVIERESWTGPPESMLAIDVGRERAKLTDCVKQTEAKIKELRERTLQSLGKEKASIFDAHLAILADPMFSGEMFRLIEQERLFAESAVWKVVDSFIRLFENMEDIYMKERSTDVRDVGRQLYRSLKGVASPTLFAIDHPVIVVTHDLTPSDTAHLPKNHVLGFASEIGGSTSHTAIMARAMGIPAVLGLGEELLHTVKNGDLIIVDGGTGELIVNPSSEGIAAYRKRLAREQNKWARLEKLKELPAETPDGYRVELAANIGQAEDVSDGLLKGAEAIGLFRSEYLYLDRDSLPSEEEQFEAYRKAVMLAVGRPVIIRTLDIGGDKQLPFFDLPEEMNPFLGWRALRISLDRIELFKTQLRALIRASAYGKLGIMFPMVSNLEQVRKAKDVIREIQEELFTQGIPYDNSLSVGVMIEIPAAAVIAHLLAREVDFFSIGTNDLVQYTLAVDRMNEKVAGLYDHFHPAVLRLIDLVIRASEEAGIWTGLCGEMAGDPLATPLLLGMGLKEWSMGAFSIPFVKERIRDTSYEEARKLALRVLQLPTGEEVRDELRKFALSYKNL